MRSSLGLIVSSLLLVVCSAAQAQDGVTTMGAFRCGTFLLEVSQGRPGEIPVADDVRWMLGFLSAANVYRNPGKDALTKIDAELVRDWTINYCKDHRNDSGAEAAMALFDRLSK